MIEKRGAVTVAGCCAVSTVLGSIHAFSVFVPEWEQLPGADRAGVSLIYSLALVSLTVAVLLGYRVYARLPPALIFVTVGVMAGVGLEIAARSASLPGLYFSYGVVFGAANGLGYGYALQLAGQSMPDRRGLAMGFVTAFYAVGATAAPLFFSWLILRGGNTLALSSVAAVVFMICLLVAFCMLRTHARYASDAPGAICPLTAGLAKTRLFLWVAYGSGVLAGLMVIGHAYGLAIWAGRDAREAALATTVVAIGNMLGGFSAGYVSDRLSSALVLAVLPVLSSVALAILLMSTASLLLSLGVIGYCYGALIAVYPVAVSDVFGSEAAPRVYGQVFTAWGAAGLIGPFVSGWLFDLTGSYFLPLSIALIFSLLSWGVVRWFLPEPLNRKLQ